MNIKKRLLPLALVMLLSPITAFAESAVPHTINLQSMVFDAEGKVTASESVDMTIRILDADNNVLFSEAQNGVVVVKGAINVNIGESSGGIPLDILDPSTGTKLIDIEIAGQSPFELMPLGALPYAMWAEKSLTVANDSIGSEQIKNGSIKAEDIDPLAFADIKGTLGDAQLPASAATVGQLTAHVNSTTAHPASAIVVSGNFVTFVATNVQEALQKLDAKLVDEIFNRQNMDINDVKGTLGQAKIDAAIARDSEVTAAVSAEATARTNADINLQNAINAEVAARANADTTLQSNINTAQTTANTAVANAASAQTTANTAVTNAATAQSTANSAASAAATAQSTADGKVSKTGDTMTGNLTMTGANIVMGAGRTVDGVDVSALDGRVTVLEGGVTWTDLAGPIPDSKVPRYMRPFAFGTFTRNTAGGIGWDLQPGSYNLSSVTNTCGASTGPRADFQSAAPSTNYIVQTSVYYSSGAVTETITVRAKTTGYFLPCFNNSVGSGVSMDVIVYGNW